MTEFKQNLPVSIVIPTCNRADLIGRSIKSVLSQTFQDFEIIVVDDASDDNTEDVVKSFDENRIRYLRHEKRKGASAARNTGIRVSTGRFIAFLDSDDEWFPYKLEKQVNKISACSDKVGVIYGGHAAVSEKTGEVFDSRIPAARGNVRKHALRYALLGAGSVSLIRKSCFERVGLFDESLQSLEDWDLYIRLSKYYEFDFVPEILIRRYMHAQQTTTTLQGKIQARSAIIQKHFNDLVKYPSIFADHLNRLGIVYALAGDLTQARKCFWRSIKKSPVQRFAYINLLPLFFCPQAYTNVLERDIARKSIDGVPVYW